jgi:FKBP-type peptidyl-prolyl cis-trans isomerase FkpA
VKPVHSLSSSILLAALIALVSLPMAGCEDSPTAPSTSAPFSKTDLVVGTGDEAAAGKVVSVYYSGWLWDPSKSDQKGLQIDASTVQSAFTFTLGAGQVIAGWDEGLVGMKEGGTRRLVVPPSMAYGSSRRASIPPNATLVFEVELLSAE